MTELNLIKNNGKSDPTQHLITFVKPSICLKWRYNIRGTMQKDGHVLINPLACRTHLRVEMHIE